MNLDKGLIKEIVDICEKYTYIDKVILFGSRARGDNELKSDIDLAIYTKGSLIDFIDDIENSTSTLLEYDISDMSKMEDEIFIEQVRRDGIIIYEKLRV